MKVQSTIMVCAAIILGFLIGALYTRQNTVKAQSEMQVYVERHYASDMLKKGPTPIPGREIVGFSCVQWNGNSVTECYTAYVK